MQELEEDFYDAGVLLELHYVSPDPDVLVHIFFLRNQDENVTVFKGRLAVGSNRELVVQIICEPNSIAVIAGKARVFEGDPNLLFPFGSGRYWMHLVAEAPYPFSRPSQGAWVPSESGSGFNAWSDETAHIREIRLFHAQAAANNFFTGYVLSYERLMTLKPPVPEPEPEPGEGGDGSSVSDAIYAGNLPFNLSVAQPVAPIMWIKVQIAARGNYEFTTATPVVVDDPSSPDTFLALYASNGVVIDTNDDADADFSDFRSRIVMEGLEAGTYFVAITGYGASARDGFDMEVDGDMPEDVNFAVLAYVPPPPPPLTKITLPYHQAFNEESAPVHWYEVELEAGLYAFDTSASLSPTQNDTALGLFRENGDLYAEGNAPGSGDYRDTILMELDAGVYRLALSSYGVRFSNGFKAKSITPLAAGAVLKVFAVVPGTGSAHDDARWIKELPFREEFNEPAPYPVVWYEVEVGISEDYIGFNTAATPDEQADTFLALFDSEGQLIAQNDDSSGLRAKIVRSSFWGKHYLALGGAGCTASDGFQVTTGNGGIPQGAVLEVSSFYAEKPVAVPITQFPYVASFPDGGEPVHWYQVEYTGWYSTEYQFHPGDGVADDLGWRVAMYSNSGTLLKESGLIREGSLNEYMYHVVSRGTYFIAICGQGATFGPAFEVNAPNRIEPGVEVRVRV